MRLPAWIPTWAPVIALAIAGVVATVNLQRDVEANAQTIQNAVVERDRWRAEHMVYHRDRAVELTGQNTRTEERLTALEAVGPRVGQIEYRTTVLEQRGETMSKAIADLQTAINTLSADVRLTVEILRRLENNGASQRLPMSSTTEER